MISERVQNYIDDHAFCSEYLFKDWESFLDLIYADGGRISSILAETQLYKDGLETNTLEEIKEYIHQERKTGFQYGSKYRSHDLVPSFYLAD